MQGTVYNGAVQGELAFDHGTFFVKGQSMDSGQCITKMYNGRLRDPGEAA